MPRSQVKHFSVDGVEPEEGQEQWFSLRIIEDLARMVQYMPKQRGNCLCQMESKHYHQVLQRHILFFPESMRVLPAELFVRTAAKNCLEDDSLIGTTSATINFKSIAHKHPTSSQITKSITSRGLPAFWLLPSRKDQLYGTPNL